MYSVTEEVPFSHDGIWGPVYRYNLVHWNMRSGSSRLERRRMGQSLISVGYYLGNGKFCLGTDVFERCKASFGRPVRLQGSRTRLLRTPLNTYASVRRAIPAFALPSHHLSPLSSSARRFPLLICAHILERFELMGWLDEQDCRPNRTTSLRSCTTVH